MAAIPTEFGDDCVTASDDSIIPLRERTRFRNAVTHLLFDDHEQLRLDKYNQVFDAALQIKFDLQPQSDHGFPLSRALIIDKISILAAHNPDVFYAVSEHIKPSDMRGIHAAYERCFAAQGAATHPLGAEWRGRIQEAQSSGGRWEQYEDKLHAITQGEPAAFSPIEFLRYALEKQGLDLTRLSIKCSLRAGALTALFNTGGALNISVRDALPSLTDQSPEFWQKRSFAASDAEGLAFHLDRRILCSVAAGASTER